MIKHRINYIDRIKGFAIFIVVLAHVLLLSFNLGDSLVYRFCASFEMPLFMFVSGFVAYIQSDGGANRKRLVKRFLAYICPAFIISYALSLYGYIILGSRDINMIDTLTGGYWYLKALAIFVCLQAILIKCKRVWMEFLLIAVAECMFLIGWKANPVLHQLFCLEHCFFFYPFFMMGYYSRRYHLVDKLKANNWVFTLSFIGFICLLNVHFDIHALRFLSERLVRPSLAILTIVYLFAERENENSKLEQWLNRIGTKTLDIYIYHGIFVMGSYACFDMKMIKDVDLIMANPILYLILAVLISLFLIYISIWIGCLIKKNELLEKVIYGKFI
jgi:fucose 4-O-acetylase-like acetyltransferase